MHFFPFIADQGEATLISKWKMCCHKPQKIVPAEKLENLCGGWGGEKPTKQQIFWPFFPRKSSAVSVLPISNKVGRNFHAKFIFVRDLLVGCF